MTLPDYIQSKMQTPFEWGSNDCITFTIGWAEEVTGKKYLPNPIWKSEIQALRRIKKEGGLEKALDKNFERIKPNYAIDGDITICNGAASILSGRFAVSVGKNGIVFKTRTEISYAWRIR